MPIKLEDLGLDQDSLQELIRDTPGRIKLRLGDGRIVDLLEEHLKSGLDIGDLGKSSTDDHDRVQVKDNDGFDKVRNTHDKTGKAIDDKFGQLVNPGNGVFIGDLTEADLVKLRQVAGDLIKEKDLMIVQRLLKKE